MPTIIFLEGIRIETRHESKELNSSHIHAIYDGFHASFKIHDGTVLKRMFPKKK